MTYPSVLPGQWVRSLYGRLSPGAVASRICLIRLITAGEDSRGDDAGPHHEQTVLD